MKDKDCGRDSETGYKEAFRLSCSLRFFLNYDSLDKGVVKILSGKCLRWLFWSDLHRAFSRDEEGCIPAEEIKWALLGHL